jgi:hypothetical protein
MSNSVSPDCRYIFQEDIFDRASSSRGVYSTITDELGAAAAARGLRVERPFILCMHRRTV